MVHFHPKKRFVVAVPLGLLAGLITTWSASSMDPMIWGSWLMWTFLANRILLGIVVGLAGAYTHHPILGFRFPWYLRGFAIGVLVSLGLGFGALSSGMDASAFWYTVIVGAIYGIVIDGLATLWGGEGKNVAG